MVFSSFVFLFIFLPVFLVVYYLTPAKYRNYTALVGSCVFYAWGAPRFLFVLALMCLLNYLMGGAIFRTKKTDVSRRRRLLAVTLCLNLCLLFYFKYANFFVAEVNILFAKAGFRTLKWTEVLLPIGISFFTFHMISYLVDVYRGIVQPANRFVDYFLYIIFFPQLIAGPIIRYHDIADQIRNREFVSARFISGVLRFCAGLGKKVLIANVLGEVADNSFAMKTGDLSLSLAWVGVLCYSFQIYFDFSGYSDMAIGLGRMLGFQFLENFNFPYIARNFTEFWRRWHISLSNFMREYLYVPLGGNRVARWRMFLNLWIVFLLSGFWHGASWNFIVWGAYHGFFLSLDKLVPSAWINRVPRFVAAPFNFVIIMFSWVFFRADNLNHAVDYIYRMLGAGTVTSSSGPLMNSHSMFILGIAILAVFVPALPGIESWLSGEEGRRQKTSWLILQFACAAVLFFLAASSLAVSGFNPFIYFRF
ncbi:MAG: MBOAT family protein [Kiritimatiellae bacterium]|nr:MBOAT family protein [Kiritimatiellia bacterium]